MNDRRGFLFTLIGGASGTSFLDSLRHGRSGTPPRDAWLAAIAGKKHRAFLDIPSFDMAGAPFRRALALVSALTDSYEVAPSDIGVAFGVHGTALAFLMNRATWREMHIAERVAPSLGSADAARLRDVREAAADIGSRAVAGLQAQGVHVLACRNTIARWAREMSAAQGVREDEIASALIAGLHEGVEVVPAMVAAAVLAQQRGIPYVLIR